MNAVPSRSIERLLRPQSVAVVGASSEPFSLGNNVLANFATFGFAGEVHPISRRHTEIDGRPCLPSIADLPPGVDVAALVVPAQAVKAAVADCAARDIAGVIVFASGFAELGEEGEREQREIARIAGEAGIALLGPNCLGFTNFVAGIPMTFERLSASPFTGQGVAVVAQSGAMTGNLREALMSRGLPVAYAISTGNEAVLGAEDILLALADDPAVGSFAVFVEQIRDPAAFLTFARRAWIQEKPVILMHTGRSQRAREAAQSHTGAMAGDYAVMETFVRAHGVTVVESFDELFDTTLLRHRYPQARIGGLAITTNSGAVRGFCLDFCETLGLPLPLLSDETVSSLATMLPDFASIDNPLDITAMGMSKPSLFGDSAAAVLSDKSVDALLVAAMGGTSRQVMAKWEAMKPVLAQSKKPVALALLGDAQPMPAEFMESVHAQNVPFFRSPERAMRAFANIHRLRCEPDLPALSRRSADGESRIVTEHAGKAFLRGAGFPVPSSRLARSAGEACAVAQEIGYPVALKVQAASIAHKSDLGAVKLHLADAASVKRAWTEIEAALALSHAGHPVEEMLVEKMASAFDLELIVSARRDLAWGIVVVVGSGGVWTELARDIRMFPAGLSKQRIREELSQLRAARLFGGYRGAAPVDIDAIVDLLDKLGRVVIEEQAIDEIEINPLAVYPKGRGVLVLDVLMRRTGPAHD